MHTGALSQIPTQKFYLSQSFQQSIHILQLSYLELIEFMEKEADCNPLLKKVYRKENPPPPDVQKKISLYEHLNQQISLLFDNPIDLKMARDIIGNLSSEGFYKEELSSAKQLTILQKIQTLDPSGIAAKDLQDTLLIQLEQKNKKKSLSYKIIDLFMHEFIQKKWKQIAKKCKCKVIDIQKAAQKDIFPLNFRPADDFKNEPTAYVIPDLIVSLENGKCIANVNHEGLPVISLAKTKKTYPKKWLNYSSKRALSFISHLHKRDLLLQKIGHYLIKEEKDFFLKNTNFKPLCITELANICSVHESTIHRAIQHKFLLCPSGMISLKTFFKGKKVSQRSILKALKAAIENENKQCPLSDMQIMKKMKEKGIPLARRTITKYRAKLKIPSTSMRKEIQ